MSALRRFKKATLTDVAQRAGVSVTTASYILNGRSTQMRISPTTERRVQAAMVDLDYRPNRSARTLRGSSTHTIGVVSDFVASGSFASQLLSGASAAARLCEHLVVIGESMGNPEVEGLLVEELLDRQVDGVIYAKLTASRAEVPEKLRSTRTVLLNCLDADGDLPAVMPDDVDGGRRAAGHLLRAGLTDSIFVVGEDPTPESTAGRDRMTGILGALGDAGATLSGVLSCEWSVRPAYDAVDDALRTGPRPAALICLNDRIAMGAYQALADHRLRVPHDVAVISFDGSDLAAWLRPQLTSLALPFQEMGRRAVEILMDRDGRATGVTQLPLELQPGASV